MAMVQLPSAKERFAVGQQRRKQMRRMEHRIWKAKDRRESPLKLLEASTRGRVPALVALKDQLMAASPFAYFRGAVPVMAYDLSLTGNTGICNSRMSFPARAHSRQRTICWACCRKPSECTCLLTCRSAFC